jgi:hypothetical protein
MAAVAPPKAAERAGTGVSKNRKALVPPICANRPVVKKTRMYVVIFFNVTINA